MLNAVKHLVLDSHATRLFALLRVTIGRSGRFATGPYTAK
jgi:hypothetical protein